MQEMHFHLEIIVVSILISSKSLPLGPLGIMYFSFSNRKGSH